MAADDDDRTRAAPTPPPQQPSLPWRVSSSLTMGLTGLVCKAFLYGLNTVEVTGLDKFLDVLDKRKDPDKRERGLITVCNHVSVLDDPLMWGVLPLRYVFNPSNMRWGLGANDICFTNKALGTFFSLGQVLPTHRYLYSHVGGPFQPTIPQAIRLLSAQPFTKTQPAPDNSSSSSSAPSPNAHDNDHDVSDPFTSPGGAALTPVPLTFSTTGADRWRAPAAYASNRHSWVHVFPEGCTHQHPALLLRYFKWGLSRLILEADPLPDVLPIFIDGTQRMMPESRTWPRFVPRVGARFRVAFGEPLDGDAVFGDLRERWQDLVRRDAAERAKSEGGTAGTAGTTMTTTTVGAELSDELKYGPEAVALRVEVAERVREQIDKLRVGLGYPDDDPTFKLAETWRREPVKTQFRSNVDGSLVNKKE